MDEQIDLAGMKVFVAMPTHRDVNPMTVNCLLATQMFLLTHGLYGAIHVTEKSAPVCHARASLAQAFLNSDATHLFWIDSDMTWTVENFFRLCALGLKLGCVGAAGVTKDEKRRLCASFGDGAREHYDLARDPQAYGCVKVDGLGLAFAIISRAILQELADKAGRVRYGRDGEIVADLFDFRKSIGPDCISEVVGEDMAFFADIRALGHDVWLDPSITLGHVGSHIYSRSFLEAAHA